MVETLRLFVLAGEPSGDRLAADLVRRLRARIAVDLHGVGGENLVGEGLASIFPMADLSVMGFRDVLGQLPRLLLRVEQTARRVVHLKPDVVVLVDAQVFSRLVAKRLRRMSCRAPVLLYVAPSVWGRAPERAARLKPLFDEVLSVLPFEPEVMQRLGGPRTSYVGHPALSESSVPAPEEGDVVALLPGSRLGELRRHLPLMRAVAEALLSKGGVERFVLLTLPTLARELEAETSQWSVPISVISDRSARSELYAGTRLAIAAAGTATLELALAGVPMIATYVMERAQAWQFERLGHPNVSLPNIVLNRKIVPEILLTKPDPTALVQAARELNASAELRRQQRQAFKELAAIMHDGLPGWPRQDPADRVLAYVGSFSNPATPGRD